jgi:hypothetical protein
MMQLTTNAYHAILCSPCNSEVGFSKPRSKGDNTPIIKSVFLCLPFFNCPKFLGQLFIMTALFVGRNPIAPLRDIANSFNAVTRFLAKSSDGFTTLSKGITP